MPNIVVDPSKIVTDEVLIRELTRQGINKDYVEFFQDYSPRSLGLEHSPNGKFYRDLVSGKHFAVFSCLSMCRPTGEMLVPQWDQKGSSLFPKTNLFDGQIKGNDIIIINLYDQPDGTKTNAQVRFSPQLFIGGIEQKPKPQTSLLDVDPLNSNYTKNVYEWDFGVCKRWVRLVEGVWLGLWVFYTRPNGDILIKYNQQGNLRLTLQYAQTNDTESIPLALFDVLALSGYPVIICDSLTFYPDAHPETASVDGQVKYRSDSAGKTWANLINSAGTHSDDSSPNIPFVTLGGYSGFSPPWHDLRRTIIVFPTTGWTGTITAATASLYGNYKDDGLGAIEDINIYPATPASNTALVAADFNKIGPLGAETPHCDTAITYAGWSTTGYNDFVLNATGIAAIGTVYKMGVRNANHDVANSAPPNPSGEKYSSLVGYFAEQGTGYKPKLVVTYTPAVPHHGFINFQDPGIL